MSACNWVRQPHDCERELKSRPDYSVGTGTPACFDCSCGLSYTYQADEDEGAFWSLLDEEIAPEDMPSRDHIPGSAA